MSRSVFPPSRTHGRDCRQPSAQGPTYTSNNTPSSFIQIQKYNCKYKYKSKLKYNNKYLRARRLPARATTFNLQARFTQRPEPHLVEMHSYHQHLHDGYHPLHHRHRHDQDQDHDESVDPVVGAGLRRRSRNQNPASRLPSTFIIFCCLAP